MARKRNFTDKNPALQDGGYTFSTPVKETEPTLEAEPQFKSRETKSKRFNLLITPTLHSKVRAAADVHGVSINQYINDVLEAYLASNRTSSNGG